MESETSQQFCLRWHNHQSSVLGGLPALLDSGRLTDVTLCAGGRSLRAHRIVLSTCSPYFMDIFKELPPNQQPVIVVLEGGWDELCCLVAFMYAGEVTIPKTLLPGLLKLASALRITGLTDLNGNVPEVPQLDSTLDKSDSNFSTPTETTQTPQNDSASSIENVSPFYKSFQSHLASKQSNIVPPSTPSSELNYANILSDESFQGLQLLKHLSLKHDKDFLKTPNKEEDNSYETFKKGYSAASRKSGRSECKRYLNPVLNEIEPKNRKIDKIVESLKCNQKKCQEIQLPITKGKSQLTDFQKCLMSISAGNKDSTQEQPKDITTSVSKAADIFAGSNIFMETESDVPGCEPSLETATKYVNIKTESSPEIIQELKYSPLSLGVHSPTNSKLYATCYVCHKQLSNQYNLRVHLETHQNIRHACVACNHVSRSRDALRKHVSYRHPQLNTSHGVGRPCKPSQTNTPPNTLQTPGTTTTNVFNFPDPRSTSESIDLSATNARSGYNQSVSSVNYPYNINNESTQTNNTPNSDKQTKENI